MLIWCQRRERSVAASRFALCRFLLVGATIFLASCASQAPRLPPVITPPVVVATPQKPLKIGLALGGGAARGFAHVGVIAVLEEAGLKPQVVVGTSAGSLVAALYASGKTSAQLQQTALNMEEVALTDWMLPLVGRCSSAVTRERRCAHRVRCRRFFCR